MKSIFPINNNDSSAYYFWSKKLKANGGIQSLYEQLVVNSAEMKVY